MQTFAAFLADENATQAYRASMVPRHSTRGTQLRQARKSLKTLSETEGMENLDTVHRLRLSQVSVSRPSDLFGAENEPVTVSRLHVENDEVTMVKSNMFQISNFTYNDSLPHVLHGSDDCIRCVQMKVSPDFKYVALLYGNPLRDTGGIIIYRGVRESEDDVGVHLHHFSQSRDDMSGTVTCMCFSPDSRVLAVGDSSGSLNAFDMESGLRVLHIRRKMAPDPTPVMDVSFDLDGRYIAGCTIGGCVFVCKALYTPSLEKIHAKQTETAAAAKARQGKGHRPTAIEATKVQGDVTVTVMRYDRNLHEMVPSALVKAKTDLHGQDDDVGNTMRRAFRGYGNVFETVTKEKSIIAACDMNEECEYTALCWLDDTLLVTSESSLYVFEARLQSDHTFCLRRKSAIRLRDKDASGSISLWAVNCCISPNKRVVATADDLGHIILWDLQNQTSMRITMEQPSHTDRVMEMVFSSDGKELLTVSWDRTIILWDTEIGKCIQKYDEDDLERDALRTPMLNDMMKMKGSSVSLHGKAARMSVASQYGTRGPSWRKSEDTGNTLAPPQMRATTARGLRGEHKPTIHDKEEGAAWYQTTRKHPLRNPLDVFKLLTRFNMTTMLLN